MQTAPEKRIRPLLILILSALLVLSAVSLAKAASAQSPALSRSSLKITVGKSTLLKVTGTSKKVAWSSSDPDIASIREGKVTAKKAGSAKITARIGRKKLYCAVTVRENKKTQKDTDDPEIIYFGDSRVVGMSLSCGDQIYVGKVSMGYSWMKGTGLSLLRREMKRHPHAQIVFCFGVNDVDNIRSYISFFRSFAAKYPKRKVWFASVNPISDSKAIANGYFIRNRMVVSFNRRLKSALPDYYLNTYRYLTKYGFGTRDGVHYTSKTYHDIENQVLYLIIVSQCVRLYQGLYSKDKLRDLSLLYPSRTNVMHNVLHFCRFLA